MKILKVDMNAGSCRIWNGDTFSGTTVVYAAKGNDSFAIQCDYELLTLMDYHKDEVRAVRENRRRAGAKLKPLPDNRIQDELVVIFGPEMSAQSAVKTLECLVKKIKHEGLLMGMDESEDYVNESVEVSKNWKSSSR
jgi:hypothetical protein